MASKCTKTKDCPLAPRAVGHLKDCPQRERTVRDLSQPELDKLHDTVRRGETVLVPQPLEVPLDDLLTPAEKERLGDVTHGMTVTYDTSPLDRRTPYVVELTPEEKSMREQLVDKMRRDLQPPPAPVRPWWKFWGRRG